METQHTAEDRSGAYSYYSDGLPGFSEAREQGEVSGPINTPDKEVTPGPRVAMTLNQAIMVAVTPESFFAKRTAPPLTVLNGRLFLGTELVFEGSVSLVECYERLKVVADGFGVQLDLRFQTGEKILWTSKNADFWLGDDSPQLLVDMVGNRILLEPGSETPRRRPEESKTPTKPLKAAPHIGRPPGARDKSPRKKRKR